MSQIGLVVTDRPDECFSSWLSNLGCNPLEYLSQYNVRFSSRYVKSLQDRADALPDEIAALKTKLQSIQSSDKSCQKTKTAINKKKEVLADTLVQLDRWSNDHFKELSDFQKNIYRKAFTTNAGDPDYHSLETIKYMELGEEREMQAPKGDVLYQFRKDVDAGELPTVSWLVPSQNLSDHPSAPWYGAWLTSEILDTLTRNPEVWKKTVFILTYDENDGYFDHIPPYVAPDPKDPRTGKCSPGVNTSGVEYIRREQELEQGISERNARGGPVGLGFRVPMIIASPWSRGGKVCSQVFDHTSPLQFLETFLNNKYNKKLKEENISEWRRTISGDLTSAFTKFDGHHVKDFPFLHRDSFLETIHNAKFKNSPSNFRKYTPEEIKAINRDPSLLPSRQEKGLRPSNALPYELYTDGTLSDDQSVFEITMRVGNAYFGDRSAGAPYIVYAPCEYLTLDSERKGRRKFEPVRAWHFAVKAGDTLTEQWPLSHFRENGYHLRVYGPNGFFREYKGSPDDPLITINCDYKHNTGLKPKDNRKLALKINNMDGESSCDIEIVDHAYKQKTITKTIPASKEVKVLMDQSKSHGWYDFSIHVKGDDSFSRSFAGRIENGRESYSDPQLGEE